MYRIQPGLPSSYILFRRCSPVRCYSRNMASALPLPSKPIHWILDWDGTITKRDTLDALVKIAAERKRGSPVMGNWKRVSAAYLSDSETALKTYAPSGKLPSSVREEKELLEHLAVVEQRSIDRVSESGIFEGLTGEQLDQGAANAIESGQVQIRTGYGDFFQTVHSRIGQKDGEADAFAILSLNWSRRFIAACLRAVGLNYDQLTWDSINSNELEGVESGKPASGRVNGGGASKIVWSRDKAVRLQTLRQKPSTKDVPVVYVGDSWTDFECLLAADLGICIRDDPMTSTQQKLAESLERVGISCPRLQNAKDENHVVWVQDFREIQNWVNAAR